jgi:DNA-binding transcriptional ArsR family regulator
VTTRRESQTIYYSLASDRATKLIGLLYELYCAPDCGVGRRANSRGKK